MRDLRRSALVALAGWVMASSTGAANATAVMPEKQVSGTTPTLAPSETPKRPQSRRTTYIDCRNGCLYSNGTWMLTPPRTPSEAASAAGR